MKQLTVSVCSQLWSQTLGYAITSNRIGSSELKENAFIGPCSCRVLYFYQRQLYKNEYFTTISFRLERTSRIQIPVSVWLQKDFVSNQSYISIYKNSLDNDFNLYSFMPRMYPFITNIKADYLIASHIAIDSYVFIIHTTPSDYESQSVLLNKLNTESS